MGYTHYWDETPTNEQAWRKFTGAIKEMVDRHNQELPIDWEYDEPNKPPQIDENAVRFNGRDEDGHETFLIPRVGNRWEFCKTARKPYDVYVVACLILLHHYNPEFTWSSDGDTQEEFQISYTWAKEVEPEVSELGLVSNSMSVAELESSLEGEWQRVCEALPAPETN